MSEAVVQKKQKSNPSREYLLLKRVLRQFTIYFLSFLIVALTVVAAVNYGYSKFFKPVDENNTELKEIEIPMGSSLDRISEILISNNLIRNKAAFKLFVDLSDKTSKLKAGKYKLSQSMTMQEIMDELLTGTGSVPTVKITIIEGWDVRAMADYLVDKMRFQFTKEEFIKAASVENFQEFSFLQEIPEERKNNSLEHQISSLEGYLFPDTYIVYQDAEPKDIIYKMLVQFEKVYGQTMMDMAEEMGMTTDEVVILASIIQREARLTHEFPMISAVFHNRLQRNKSLESCATIQFIINEKRWSITQEEMSIPSPYNTYINPGLPAGPISSPGKLALMSALNPFEDFMDPKRPYLYFVLMDPDKGEHVFNYDYNAHLRDKEKYEKLWQEKELE